VAQPMCLLTLLIMSITHLIYLCVSRYCVCQHLPLLLFFYHYDCDCYTPPFHTLSIKLLYSLSLRFQIINTSNNYFSYNLWGNNPFSRVIIIFHKTIRVKFIP